VSFDRAVSETQCAALKQAGYLVTPTTRREQALELLSSQKFDRIIVGHRFRIDDKRALAVEARGKWNRNLGLLPNLTIQFLHQGISQLLS